MPSLLVALRHNPVIIVPLASLLSEATSWVAAKTGGAIGALLNATLGTLTELVIAITALRAGEYVLVKASVAGAIVTNSLFIVVGFVVVALISAAAEMGTASLYLMPPMER